MAAQDASAGLVLRAPGMPALTATALVAFSGFGLLVPLSPAWVVHGGADELAAGSVTTVLMAFTILSQLQVNRLLRRYGWGTVLMAGVVLLGAPAPLQALSPNLTLVLVDSAVRGVGFGILTVCGATAITLLVPVGMRGRAVGAYGLAIALPQLLFTSAAPLLAERLGMRVVLALGAVPLLGLLWLPRLGRHLDRLERRVAEVNDGVAYRRLSRLGLLRRIWPALLGLLVVTSAGGALLTFATQIAPTSALAALALLCLTGAGAPSRWLGGWAADHWGTTRSVVPLLAVTALATATVGLSTGSRLAHSSTLLLLTGSAVLGVAYGSLQSVTLVRAFRDAGEAEAPRTSVAWNVNFDLGTGLGAILLGLVAQASTFEAALLVMGAVTLVAAVAIAVHDVRQAQGTRSAG